MAFDVGSVVAKIDADITGFKQGIKTAQEETQNLGKTLSNVGDGIMNFAKQASLLSAGVAAAVLAAGKVGLDSAGKFEQYQIAFSTLLKSQEKAAEAIKAIQEDAKKTPFEMAPLVMANQRLISAGVNADQARKDIISLGNAISATGGGNSELERLSTNLQQIKAVGKASALDIKQFAFAGINVYKLLADATGKNVEQVKDMDVSYEMLTDAFDKASQKGGMFENAMANQSTTLNGLMSTLRDTVSIGLKDLLVDSGIFDIIRNGVAAAIPFLEQLIPKIVDFFKAIPQNPTVVAIFNFIKDALTTLGEWVMAHQELVLNFLKGMAIAFGAIILIAPILVAALNPFILVFAAIEVAAGLLFAAWNSNFMGIRDITMKVVNEIMNFFNKYLMPAIQALVGYFQERWEYLKAITTGTWEIIKGIITVAWNIIYGLIKVGLALISGDWGAAWDAIKTMTTNVWEGIKGIFGGAIDFIKGWGGLVVHNLVAPFEEAWNKIKEFVQKIKDNLDFTKRHSPSVVDIVNKGVREVNNALSGLDTAFNMTPKISAAGIANTANGPMVTNIKIDLAGAVIADEYSAQNIAEMLGDNIIKKLEHNIRI